MLVNAYISEEGLLTSNGVYATPLVADGFC